MILKICNSYITTGSHNSLHSKYLWELILPNFKELYFLGRTNFPLIVFSIKMLLIRAGNRTKTNFWQNQWSELKLKPFLTLNLFPEPPSSLSGAEYETRQPRQIGFRSKYELRSKKASNDAHALKCLPERHNPSQTSSILTGITYLAILRFGDLRKLGCCRQLVGVKKLT